jgi:hypothetical protein
MLLNAYQILEIKARRGKIVPASFCFAMIEFQLRVLVPDSALVVPRIAAEG